MTRNSKLLSRMIGLVLLSLLSYAATAAQSNLEQEREVVEASSDRVFYTILLVIGLVLVGGGVLWWRRTRSNAASEPAASAQARAPRSVYFNNESYDLSAEAEKDLEWLRQVKKKAPKMTYTTQQAAAGGNGTKTNGSKRPKAKDEEENLDTKMFQEKMRRMQYTQLPINSFSQLAPAKNFQPLADSDD